MKQVRLVTLKCAKCGHEWTPRKPEVHICPKCKTYRWQEK